jgi:WD40 repeat protein
VALICVSGGDCRARLYDAAAAASGAGGKEVCQLAGHSDALNWGSFNTACNLIATASDDCSIRVWRPPQYDPINRVLECPPICLHVLRGSPSSASNAGHSGVDAVGHTAAVTAVEFVPDGGCMVSSSADRTIRTWDPWQGRLLRILSGHCAGSTCVACSPSVTAAVSGCEDGGIKLWDIGVDAGRMDRPDGARGQQLTEVFCKPGFAAAGRGGVWEV